MTDERAKVLGRQVAYPQTYQPEILVAIPRQASRQKVGLDDDALPFMGADVWHAYEASCLTDNGVPTAGIMKIVVPADSRSIVESKSLKLYLNSFNMERMGPTPQEANDKMAATVASDLSRLLEAEVKARCYDCRAKTVPTPEEEDFFAVMEDLKCSKDLKPRGYAENPSVIETRDGRPPMIRMRLKSYLLRTKCPVTHQPDWGTVYIWIEGDLIVHAETMLEYIISLRDESHFHEEVCELIFKRLHDLLNPRLLMVTCRYTRRGGIDITPVRSTSPEAIYADLLDVDKLTARLERM